MILTRSCIRCCCFLIFIHQFISTLAQDPCPSSYPRSCQCFSKSKWIKCNGLATFPSVFNNDTKWLTMENSQIKNITKKDFENLPQLTDVSLRKGILRDIEEGTFQQLQNLNTIDLSENSLETKSFPNGTFANLINLKTVKLSGNPISSLPDDMFKNTTVETLSMMNSQLDFPGLESIGKGRVAKSLKTLHFDGSNLNRLTNEMFSGLANLKTIGLTNCHIQYIHTDFLKGTKVTHVDLYQNPIVKIDADAMRGDKIIDFTCRHCGLTSEKVFGKESFFLQMTALERLDLGHNKINHVPKDAFKGMTVLTTLLLFYNNISSIERNPFLHLSSPQSMGIQNNPFRCDCNLTWFHKYALEHLDTHVVDDIICASPSKLDGKGFKDLKDSQFCCEASVDKSAVCGYGVVNSAGYLVLSQFNILIALFFAVVSF